MCDCVISSIASIIRTFVWICQEMRCHEDMHNIIWMHIAQMHIMYVQDSVLNVPDIEILYKMSKYDVMLPSSLC